MDDVRCDTTEYGSLSQYMAEPTIALRQYHDKVHLKLNKLNTDDDEIFNTTLEIPLPFKDSIFCQAIIAYCYTDYFNSLADSTKDAHVKSFRRFFLFLVTHDESAVKSLSWADLLTLPNGDLPHDVIHQFLLFHSEDGLGANSIYSLRMTLKKPITWASEIDIESGEHNFKDGDILLPYLKRKVSPKIKKDDVVSKLALSQLFSIDYSKGEKIECPYSDSQLVSNLRWFAQWYLKIMRERRLFLREIMWDEEQTIYEILINRLKSGYWSLGSFPVRSMYGSKALKNKKQTSLEDFVEASAMYAKIYEALLPTKNEIEQIVNAEAPDKLKNRLIWLESEGFQRNGFQKKLECMPEYESDTENIIKRIEKLIAYNYPYSPTANKHEKIKLPIVLQPNSNGGIRSNLTPMISLANMIVPTQSELLVMSWLLGSDCIQWSNQCRLNLSDLKQLKRGKTLQILDPITIDEDDINAMKVSHYKKRSKKIGSKSTGKTYQTIEYLKGDPLFTTYSHWLQDMTEAQPYLVKGKGKWLYVSNQTRLRRNAIIPFSFLIAKKSLFRSAFENAENESKFHSDLNGQGAFQWILCRMIEHDVYHKKNLDKSKQITLNVDAIRQSRIIFNESHGMSDAQNAKESAHSEGQVHKYREAGIAKERIQNGIKGNVQIANKMVEEAISIINSCHIMSVEEVEKSLHAPSGFTTNDVVELINEFSATPQKYDVTIFGGIIEKSNPESGIKIINDEKSAWMMWCYITHMESELGSIKENHDEQQVVKHLFEHAQWSILFERFSTKIQQEAKALSDKYSISYPPLF